MTRIVLLNADELSPGEKSFAQLILADEDVVVAGDHFVLRSYSPVTTIGGGRILDPLPGKHKRKNKKYWMICKSCKAAPCRKKFPSCWNGPVSTASMSVRLLFDWAFMSKNPGSAGKLFSDRQAILLSGDDTTALSSHLYAQLEDLLMKSLADYHQIIL